MRRQAPRRGAQPAKRPSQRRRPPLAAQPTAQERLRQIERRKARSRAFSMTVIVLLIMVVTVFAIVFIMREAAPSPRFAFIQEGRLDQTLEATALIAREENLFHAPADGTLKPLVSEGSRTARGQRVALVIPDGKEAELAEWYKCEKDIVDLQNQLMKQGQGPGARAIYEESAESLASVVSLIRKDLADGSLDRLLAYQMSLDMILEQRTAKLMTVDFKDTRLNQLKQTREALQESLGLQAATLISQQPGLVSYKFDGLEETLNAASLQTLSAAQIQQHLDQSQGLLPSLAAVQRDQPVLRLFANLHQTLALVLDGNQVASFPLDSNHTLTITDSGLPIEACRVVRLEKEGDQTLVVFQTGHRTEWLADRRTVDLTVTLSRATGLKVPYEALIEPDHERQEAGLMLVVEGFTRLSRVSIKATDRVSAIVEPLASQAYQPTVSTILVVNPKTIEEGEFIGN